MRSTKSSPASSVLVSRTLKTVGVVIILATLLDIVIGAIPYNLGDRQWQIGFTTSLVDRGIVPMVGVVLFLTGFWIDGSDGAERKSLFTDPRFWALAFSSFLGALYLLLFPLHLSNVSWNSQQAATQIEEKAKQAETELSNQLNGEVNSQRSQIEQLLTATDEQLTQLVSSNQLSKEQADLIRKFKADPKQVEPFLNKRIEETKTQLQTRIGSEKLTAQQKAKSESLKSGLRIGISSLLLAAGFIVIGWTGLRNLGQ
jgi:CHASE3 domain sensor protein